MKGYGAAFLVLQGFGGGFMGGVFQLWGVKINTLRSRLPIAMLYLGKFGSEAIF